MQIISGKARRIELDVPSGLDVRPTAVRARKALFDSLGDFTGAAVVDLFAGCGALGLEAASRGAGQVLLVEQSARHCDFITGNIVKVKKSGVETSLELYRGDALGGQYYFKLRTPDVIFADPPYPVSVECFKKLTNNKKFINWADGALLVWEIPDAPGLLGEFVNGKLTGSVRKFGGTQFFLAVIETEEK